MSKVNNEKKFRYLLYRVQQALLEMDENKSNFGKRHLENGLAVCTGLIDLGPTGLVTHEEMEQLREELCLDL